MSESPADLMIHRVCCTLGMALAAGSVAAEDLGPSPSSLVLSHRFASSDRASKIWDVRWADEDSVYLLRIDDGVTRHRLEPGLPVLEQSLPGSLHDSRIQDAQLLLGVSDRFVFSSYLGISNVWKARSGAGATVHVEEWPYFLASDLDIHGNELALLGGRKRADGGESRFELGVFRANIRETLEGLRLDHELDLETPEALAAGFDAMHFGAGSIRYSAKGELLVAIGFSDEIVHYSASGKRKGQYHLEDLGFDYSGARATFQSTGSATADRYRRFRTSAVLIDDVLWLGAQPAVVVRTSPDGRPEWWLVILDGTEPRRYRVPLPASGGERRVRVDGSARGDIVVVVGAEVAWKAETKVSSEEIFVFSVPDF